MSDDKKPLNFTLFDLERLIAQRNYPEFAAYLTRLLIFIDNKSDIESRLYTDEKGEIRSSHVGLVPFTNQLSFSDKLDLYSRLASTITNYLSDTQHTPDNVTLLHFVIYKTHIMNIFYLSCYGNTDHILFNRALLDENNTLKLQTDQDILFLYVCLSLNTNIQFNVEQLVTADPLWGMYWYLGLLYGRHHSYNTKIESNLNKVIDAHPLIQTMPFDDTAVEISASPWMLCSYLDRDDRHKIKQSINIALQKWIKSKQIPAKTYKNIANYINDTSEIKNIIVLSEHYTSKHAMYRCYHPELKLLKEHFHVTLVSPSKEYDSQSKADFHKIIDIDDSVAGMVRIVKEISKLKPDLIFFPSIGMATWTIPLANMRLAKHQLMCYGHPASAFSQFIDYSYSSEPKAEWNFQQFFMEKLAPLYQGKDFIWEPHPDYRPQIDQKPHDGVIRIAINSSLPKITIRFINLCKILLEHSSAPIEFNFFLTSNNTAFEKSLFKRLGASVKVYPPADYTTYMKNLSRCDLAIGTFPFGGSNTNTDIALLGIPKIIYSEGCGLASYSDQTALEKLNLPVILMPKSEGELLANLIYLIHNEPFREELSTNIKKSNPYDLFYKQKSDESAVASCKLVDVIRWIETAKTKTSPKKA
ncbi:hypothetical protein [Alkalimarinus alittae]|uniref:HMW1C N-terminal domain-containing protein n=1 Tax=Alkalimarinus alittae TaxID=2961619 RepID=A0ABY6N620_9ALTE|nr:hypothetical protein [Alkalimarinus alittae]UZE97563.1 hypothetical protein NKI27_07420 [Alkalimarinus alittae]